MSDFVAVSLGKKMKTEYIILIDHVNKFKIRCKYTQYDKVYESRVGERKIA